MNYECGSCNGDANDEEEMKYVKLGRDEIGLLRILLCGRYARRS